MFTTKEHSLARRLTWMNMLVCAVALVLACSAFIGYDLMSFRGARVRSLSMQAQVIGANTLSALSFDDPEAAARTMSALSADPHVLSALLYTTKGKLFASYSRPGSGPIPQLSAIPQGQMESHWIGNGGILLARSIVLDNKPIGVLYIRSDVETLYKRLELYAGIASIVLLISLLAGLGMSALFRKSVAQPIVRLAEITKISLDYNSTFRVPTAQGLGEVSVLINSFNGLLEQIEVARASLQKANDELETRVEARTAELVVARKEVEAFSESVLRAKEEVERASRFKDQFLSTMSHELRTPLNAVLGFSELMTDARYGPLSARQARYVHHIHTSGQHLLRLINDILDLSKIEAGRLQLSIEDVSVTGCFAELADSLQPLVDKNSQKLLQSAAPGLAVRADPTRFTQMVMNLLGNAIKFTPKGGSIELAAQPEGDFIRVEVRDSGPGIPPEDQRRIFEAFHRLTQSDKTTEGTGLGLAITRSLVELHGGKLGIESQPGAGSCFFFTLPAASPARETGDCSPGSAAHPSVSARILVVEDDPAAADLLDTQLCSAGYQVVVCSKPQEAVEMAAELQPAVITLDIVMLPVNGWDILAALKSDPRTARIGVVIVSVMDQKETGALLGADEYIVKPVDKSILLAAVERCLRRRGGAVSGQSILVVEDDMPTREFVTDLLARNGYRVQTASDGEQARAHVQAALPDLVLLDLLLPGVNGFGLIAEWRNAPRTRSLPIFVLTNKDLSPSERDYLRANAQSFFSKRDQWRDELISQTERVIGAQHEPQSLLTESL